MAKQRIVRVSVVDQICEFIKRSIADGTLRPNDKLGSESELADQFGVNRFTVRLALQKLSTLGLIDIKMGEGSFVSSASARSFIQEMQMFLIDGVPQEDIRRLRAVLETDSILLAAQRATVEDKNILKQMLDEYSALLEQVNAESQDEDIKALVAADMDFHVQIIRMSHNMLYAQIYMVVEEQIKAHIQHHIDNVRRNSISGNKKSDKVHQLAYQAIIEGDREKTRQYREIIFSDEPPLQ